ncbi:MAG: enoyl-CoA hydratase-related protein [Anaerovoracaceae bacterium]
MYNTIKYEVKDSIAYVTICRPEAMNALSNQVLDELYLVFSQFENDDTARVAILTGEGKAFVAGADIAAMNQMTAVEGRAMMMKGHKAMNLMESIEKPIIGAINGFALGGGCELAMACDIRIASEKAKFGQPEVNLGIMPGFGGTQRLPRLVGRGMGKYLIFTAEIINAEEAYRIGLVEKVAPHDELISACEALANVIISKAPIAIGCAKTAINNGYNLDVKTAGVLEVETFTGPFSSVDKTEGMTAFLEKRPATFINK